MSPDVLLGAPSVTPIVADKPSAHPHARASTHTFLFPLTEGPTDAAPIASALIPALVREQFPLNVSVQSFHHPLFWPSPQDVSKRLSLPMDIRLPPEFLQKLQMESPEFPKPLSRMSRRASLVSLTLQERAVPGTASRFVRTSPSQQMHVLIATHPSSHAPLCKLTCTVCASWRYARTHPCP